MKLNIIHRNEQVLAGHKIVGNGVLFILLLLLTGCEKDLEPGLPSSQLIGEAIFDDTATVDAALTSIYSGLRDNSTVEGTPSGATVLMGLYADELDYYRADAQTDAAFFNHTVLPSNGAVDGFWNNNYALIYQSNAILEGLEEGGLTMEEKGPFMGEAYFLRAYLHFYLSQLYGEIPYIVSTDYTQNSSPSRMPLPEIYELIEQDLLQAKELLAVSDASGEHIRATKGAASALLARCYLYTQQWEKAKTESTAVIEGGVYVWQPELDQVFLRESPSIIWQLKPEFEGAATKAGEIFVFENGPPPLYALTDLFISNFESGDLRKGIWTRAISDGTDTWYHAFKYKQNTALGSSSEYSVLFRLAEVYLIRAETLVRLGNIEAAKNDINKIRQRAGLDGTKANSVDALLEELVLQRKYELFTEQGHRWFDLKRLQLANEILGPVKPNWNPTDVLLPLPQQELILNPSLQPQNPGY